MESIRLQCKCIADNDLTVADIPDIEFAMEQISGIIEIIKQRAKEDAENSP